MTVEQKKEGLSQGKKDARNTNSGYFLTKALREILADFPQISPWDIRIAACIYYPIADLDLNIRERLFEDFDNIEHNVLRFIDDLGADVGLIAQTTGLSRTYVSKIFHLLDSYGFITDGHITALAKESLAEGKKITCTETAQKVQMDALTLHLLRIDELIRAEDLIDRAYTSKKFGIIPCVEGIERKEVEQRLADTDLRQLIRYDRSILNANTEEIIHVECADMRYAKCVMLVFKEENSASVVADGPIIFGKRAGMRQRKYQPNQAWLPLFVPDAEVAAYLGNDGTADNLSEISGDRHPIAEESVQDLYQKLLAKQEKDCSEEEVQDENSERKRERRPCDGRKKSREQFEKILTQILDLSAGVRTSFEENGNAYIGMNVDITAESLVNYHANLPGWLQDIAKRGTSILSFDSWYGAILRITTSDERLRELAAKFCQCVEEHGFLLMMGYWKQEFMSMAEESAEEQSLYVRMMDSLLPARIQQYVDERGGS